MSSAMDRALMAMSLEDEDEAPFSMPNLPEYCSNSQNERSLIGRLLNPDCQKVSNVLFDMPRKWQKVGKVRGVALSKERFQFIFKEEYDLQEVLDKGTSSSMEKEDLYAVMDLNDKCSQGDLRLSYKNLALKWHPDRFSKVNEKDKANTKFQSIQKAYSVLSDSNKRMLYDIGAYDSDDDETGMADFINEMVTLMAQTQSTGDETLEEFEKLFGELLMDDVNDQFITPSSFPYAPFSGTVHGNDSSNDDIPNKANVDSYCLSSGED